MKKYVIDFAKDEMKKCSKQRKSKIQEILMYYEIGLITSREAIKSICDIYYK